MAKRKPAIEFDIKTLREILDYDPDTGILTWKPRPEKLTEYWTPKGAKAFNSKYAGHEAGCTRKVKNRDYTRKEIKLPDGKNYLQHRVAWAWMTGEWPTKLIDHKDQNPLHNWWDNLREVDDSTNQKNATLRSTNRSGIPGVHFDTGTRRWIVSATDRGTRTPAKRFKTLLDAAAHRIRLNRELGFTSNHGRHRLSIAC